MSYAQPLEKIGYLSSDDDRSVVAFNQFYGVHIGTAANIVGAGRGNPAVIKPSAGGSFYGILQNNPVQGEACEITRKGTSQAYAGGSFAVGDKLKVDGNGAFVKGVVGTDTIVAQAVEQAVAGDITTVYILG
jgi:hypothetical protein